MQASTGVTASLAAPRCNGVYVVVCNHRQKEELGRLRRENKVLRQVKEILRKATAFFASEDGIR